MHKKILVTIVILITFFSATSAQAKKTTVLPIYPNSDLGYSIDYPRNWNIDDSGIQTKPAKEVRITRAGSNITYLTIHVLTNDSIQGIINNYKVNFPNIKARRVSFAGQRAYLFVRGKKSREVYVPYQGKIYRISTDYYTTRFIPQSFNSFRFLNAQSSGVTSQPQESAQLVLGHLQSAQSLGEFQSFFSNKDRASVTDFGLRSAFRAFIFDKEYAEGSQEIISGSELTTTGTNHPAQLVFLNENGNWKLDLTASIARGFDQTYR